MFRIHRQLLYLPENIVFPPSDPLTLLLRATDNFYFTVLLRSLAKSSSSPHSFYNPPSLLSRPLQVGGFNNLSQSAGAAVTKYHRQGVGGVGAYKQQNLLSQSSGGWGSMENLRSGAQTAVFSLSPQSRGVNELGAGGGSLVLK